MSNRNRKAVFKIDPDDENVSFKVDWSCWLDTDNSETISSSTWHSLVKVTEVSSSNTTLVATIAINGIALGSIGQATNKITTSTGRVKNQTVYWESERA
jgi:hypothetical protein